MRPMHASFYHTHLIHKFYWHYRLTADYTTTNSEAAMNMTGSGITTATDMHTCVPSK